MSIIHDALKKIQKDQGSKPGETPAKPAAGNDYVYSQAPAASEQPVEYLSPAKDKARSVFPLIAAIAFILVALFLLYKQLDTYFPNFIGSMRLSVYKTTHKTPAPVPLAKIVVTPRPKPVPVPAKTVTPAATLLPLPPPPPPAPETLNVHGVMANGSNNVALINNQVYQEGDVVDGIKIVKISLNSITVNDNGNEKIIPVDSN